MRRQSEASHSERGGRNGRPSGASIAARALSIGLIATGVLMLAWVLATWRWQEPITAIEHWHDQGALAAQLRSRHVPTGSESLLLRARAFRLASHEGEAMGRILIPRLGLDTVLVEGTSEADLARGPGFYARDYLPGEGRLVYVAGHRTTYSAPFAEIDLLRNGDAITVRMPYGAFHYRVTGHRIVLANDVEVLRSTKRERLILQSCHPRFSATHRYLVYALPVRGRAR